MPSKYTKRTGAIVAIAVVVVGVILPLTYAILTGSGTGQNAVPVVSLACVVLGSILTIPKRTRQFAVGFLITSAILLFVTAGACVALFLTFASQL
jgi:hypothetical protein